MTAREIEELYRRHGPGVLRRARAILGDEAAAQDALQEVFVRALRAGRSFRHDASPTTWLHRVTTNYCLNQIRDAKTRDGLLRQHGEAAAPRRSGPDTETRVALAQLLRRVPADLREVAVCFYLDEMTQDEAAEVLGVSRRTIGNRLKDFRERARRIVGRGEGQR